ncbi:MAG: SMP-30/gluconolactonase/LRE family protein [Verrucomicrobiae bacterium]|nr:SMP-30/gluconolactonase/LRE family protein [Verrucomicrobiae bacterium]
MRIIRRLLPLVAGVTLCIPPCPAAQPVLLYSRYFNAEGEDRYVPDKDYSEVLQKLGETFEIRVNRNEPTSEALADVDVVLISNPSQAAVPGHPAPPRFSAGMIDRLEEYVESGGGLIMMGNQENHNLELETTNQLLRRFGMAFEESFTDIKALPVPESVPMIGGLKWGYYSGNLLTLKSDHPSRPTALVENDLNQPLLKGTRDARGPLLATATSGKGRVIVATDAGWITNTVLSGPGIANVKIDGHQNFEIFRRLALWAAANRRVPATSDQVFAGPPQLLLNESAGEGPAWDDALGLLTSHGGHIHQWKDGSSSVYRKDAQTNGLLFDSKGNLLCCEPGRKRVTRMTRDKSVAVLSDNFMGHAYNSPNDITTDHAGRIYFSDPRYGSRDGMEILDDAGKAVEGVYRIDLDGTVTRIITHEVDRPNGVLISKDQKWMFVADNNNNTIDGARRLYRFAFNDTTSEIDPASRQLLFDWGSGRGPDGMTQAASGVLYVAAGRTRPNHPDETTAARPGGIYAFSENGDWLGFAPIPADEVTNCAIGGTDRRTLFVTAGGQLWTIPLANHLSK